MSLFALILANLLVAFLVALERWGYYEALLIFWCEALALVAVVLAAGLVAVAVVRGLAEATTFTVVIILLKLGADVASHLLEHRRVAERQ